MTDPAPIEPVEPVTPEPAPEPKADPASEYLKQIETLRKEVEAKEKVIKERETSDLTAKEEYKTLYERTLEERNNAVESLESMKTRSIEQKKTDAVRESALKLGLRPEAVRDLDMIDLSDVRVEGDTMEVVGADTFAERLKTLRGHWFADQAPPNVNTRTPSIEVPAGPVSWQDLQRLQKEGKRTGDMTQYTAAYRKYRSQPR